MKEAKTLTEGREAENLEPEHLGHEQAGLRSVGWAILGGVRGPPLCERDQSSRA